MSATAELLTLVREGPTIGAIAFSACGPARMTAGSLERWTFTFSAREALPAGCCLAIAHRWPCDWGVAQGSDPGGVDFLDVRTHNGSAVRWWTARLHTWHPFDHVLFVELPDGLAASESVKFAFGEPRDGSPGFRVQTFIEEGSPFSLRWRAREGEPWTELAQHRIEVVGAEPFRLVATVPSRIAAEQPLSLHVRVEDRWGNPATLPTRFALEVETDDRVIRIDMPRVAFMRAELPPPTIGVHRVRARGPGLACESNPVEVADGVASAVYWGDLHGQSVIGCGARSIDSYYAHARDFAAADIGSHQANCFLVSSEEWTETLAANRRHHAPGQFVNLLGVEWSAISQLGGDHNVYFPGDEAALHRCSHEFVADRRDLDTDFKHVEELYRHYRGSDTLFAVHVGGRTTNLGWHDAGLDRLLEVHSTHATSEWFLLDALRRGYRMGVIAGSDGVDGRPAASHPGHMAVRNVRGGLTAVLAPALTRPAIWAALRQRHCYATTGERILLDFRRGVATMGDDATLLPDSEGLAGFAVKVEGTAPVESLDFFRDDACLASIDAFAAAASLSSRLRVAWRGTTAQGNWQRARMVWDGSMRIEGTRIVGVTDYAFDTPDEGVLASDAGGVTWRSVTAGDWDGVVLDLSERGRGELAFVSEPMTLRTGLSDVGPAGRRFAAQDPERLLELRWLPKKDPPRTLHAIFADRSPLPGTHAYWVRVRQADGAFAWSSPIFVTLAEH